jgi:Rha family phage regulatory protein
MAAKKQLEIVFTPKIINNEVRIDSRQIAEQFGRGHNNVMQSVRNIIETGELNQLDFKLITYVDERGREQPMYEFTEDGAYIVMPFIGGVSSVKGQVALVRAFRAARDKLKTQVQTPGTYLEALEALVGVERDRLRLTAEVQVLAPRAIAFDQAVSVATDLTLVSDAARFLNGRGIKVEQKKLFEWLIERGWMIKTTGGEYANQKTWSARAIKQLLGEVKFEVKNGRKIRVNYLTPKGFERLASKLFDGSDNLALAA